MNNWYLCSVRYEKTMENGTQGKVTEKYLVNAETCTDAENRLIEEITPFIVGEFEVRAVAKENIAEIFNDDKGGDQWFKVKLNFLSLDERTGAEKKSKVTAYVAADSLQAAVKNIEEGMKGSMSDWEFSSICETNVIEVYNEQRN